MHLFLSPHSDDAVYSCGGCIAQLALSGADVQILTLMAGTPAAPLPDTPVLRDNHGRWDAGTSPMRQRREEDRKAAELLGASVHYADLLDCIYRMARGRALYPTEDALWGEIHPDDPASGQLRALELPPAQTLYAPLGVGAHVDHRLVRDWALEVAAQNPPFAVVFYAEYPYLRQPEAVTAALDALPLTLVPQTVPLSDELLTRKIAAMKAYRSQISSFWEDEAAVAAEVRRTFTLPAGGWGEHLYRITV